MTVQIASNPDEKNLVERELIATLDVPSVRDAYRVTRDVLLGDALSDHTDDRVSRANVSVLNTLGLPRESGIETDIRSVLARIPGLERLIVDRLFVGIGAYGGQAFESGSEEYQYAYETTSEIVNGIIEALKFSVSTRFSLRNIGDIDLSADDNDALFKQCVVLACGGGPGLMEAVSEAGRDAGVPVVGMRMNGIDGSEQEPSRFIDQDRFMHFYGTSVFRAAAIRLLGHIGGEVSFRGGAGSRFETMASIEDARILNNNRFTRAPFVTTGTTKSASYWERELVDYLHAVSDSRFGEGVVRERLRPILDDSAAVASIFSRNIRSHFAPILQAR